MVGGAYGQPCYRLGYNLIRPRISYPQYKQRITKICMYWKRADIGYVFKHLFNHNFTFPRETPGCAA